jgi:tight adherence protein C
MSALRAIVVVGVGLLGVTTLVRCLPRFRRPSLSQRLTPYLGALGPQRSRLLANDGAARSGVAAAFQPFLEDLGARLQRLFGDDGRDLPGRLAAAGSPITASGFRAEQARWGIVAFTGGVALSVGLAASGRAISPVVGLLVAVAFGAIGIVGRDRSLTRAVGTRREQARSEFPTVVDMVCLAVTAGESLRGALELVASSGTGPLAGELRAALRVSRGGVPLADALAARARILGLAPFDRFVAAVVAAQERGMPLGEALRAMASDVRESEKRDVIEAAGRKQVSMLVPVVGLILPVAILFAFYPGVVAIRTLAR